MKKYSILIIDDSEEDRYLLKRSLKKTALISMVFEMDNGESGLEFLIQPDTNKTLHPEFYPPDIIFLDINMPLMNGFEFLSELKKLRGGPDSKLCRSPVVLMLSSSERQEDIDMAKSYDFVKKFIVKGQSSTEDFSEIIEAAMLER